MYYLMVAATLFALPLLCILLDAHGRGSAPDLALLAKWYTFWAVGVRLFLAGVRQVIQPQYTASVILGIKEQASLLLVRELGFGNLAIGLIGLLSIAIASARTAAALAGGVFYCLAGLNHLVHSQRNRLQSVAMITDLFAAAVLFAALAGSGLGR
jgi:hypothetical protein